MSKFKIKLARIEAVGRAERDPQVCITFQVDRERISLQVPIFLRIDLDDTEMVRAARSALHRVFVELAAQSRSGKLSTKDLQQLSKVSSRPKV